MNDINLLFVGKSNSEESKEYMEKLIEDNRITAFILCTGKTEKEFFELKDILKYKPGEYNEGCELLDKIIEKIGIKQRERTSLFSMIGLVHSLEALKIVLTESKQEKKGTFFEHPPRVEVVGPDYDWSYGPSYGSSNDMYITPMSLKEYKKHENITKKRNFKKKEKRPKISKNNMHRNYKRT